MGVHDDTAGLCLTEDAGQSDYGNHLRVYNVPQHVSGSDARQLVDVSDKDKPHVFRNGLHEVVHQDDVYHGAFIDDERVSVKGILVIALVAVHGVVLQQPVNGFGFHAGGLAHPLGSSARRCCEKDMEMRLPESSDDTLCRGGLARAGTSRQHHDLAFHRLLYGGNLNVIVLNTGFPLYGLYVERPFKEGGGLRLNKVQQLACRPFL